jgi:TonB-linked SusC/RagA family outer membrane protein
MYAVGINGINSTEKNSLMQDRSIKISGMVMDERGEPMIGVHVKEDGTNNATVTDMEGNYTLYNIKNTSSKLIFTYIGYKTYEFIVGQTTLYNVKMEQDSQGLEEVVVVGYGAQKRESIVGAISTVRPAALQVNQTRTISNALAGQIAGVVAVQRSGEPGYDSSEFWIRGMNTFGASSNPLVLVDGIERDINSISAEEIESFSILKDASATAVYGVRGANGVILVQTKKGQLGKPRVTVKADFGVSNPTQLPKFVDGARYMEITNEAFRLSGLTPTFTQQQIDNTRNKVDPDLFPDVNWVDAITRKNAPSMRASLDVNGGSELIRYSLIVSYFGEQGMFVRDKSQSYNNTLSTNRYNVRSNVDINLTKSTIMSVSIGGYIYNRQEPESTEHVLNNTFEQSPIAHPIIYSNGQLPKNQSRFNPWAEVTQRGYRKRFESSIQSTVSLEQDMEAIWSPLKGLKAKGIFSFDNWGWTTQDRNRFPTYYWATGRDEEGNLITNIINEGDEFLGYGRGGGGNRTMYAEAQLSYNRRFGLHGVDGLFLFNMRDYVNSDAGSAILSLPYRNQGIAGRVAYNYNDKYFTEFNFGYNGSENFKKGYRFGFFPSVAVGWLITNEPFMQNVTSSLSKLKIRGSVGKVGNDKISNDRRFAYLSTIEQNGDYRYGWTANNQYTGYREGEFGIPDLTWETATKVNGGIEIGLWNSINFQADYFKEYRNNIFMERRSIPEIAGFSRAPWANYGKVENQGIDMSLEINRDLTKDLFISFRGNFTYAKNKITEIDEAESLKNTTRSQTGQSLNQHYGLIVERLFTPDDFSDTDNYVLKEGIPKQFGVVKPGDIKYLDIDGDGTVTDLDKCPIGKPWIPEIVYGFGSSIRYKQFDISFFFQGSANFTNMLGGSGFIPGSGAGAFGNIYTNADDRWTPEDPYNQNVLWPRLSNYNNDNNTKESTWWLRNSSFLRLKNAEIGYTLPKKWQRAVRMRNARVFARGTNLFTISGFDMWDPEVGSNNGLKYPNSRIYSMGFEVTF